MAMFRTLGQADVHGLDAKTLIPPGLDDLLVAADADKRRRGEVVLKSDANLFACIAK